jgi:hypothetical protein
VVEENFGRGGGDRTDKLLNKACALYALQLPPLSNRNKRNKPVCQFRHSGTATGYHWVKALTDHIWTVQELLEAQ